MTPRSLTVQGPMMKSGGPTRPSPCAVSVTRAIHSPDSTYQGREPPAGQTRSDSGMTNRSVAAADPFASAVAVADASTVPLAASEYSGLHRWTAGSVVSDPHTQGLGWTPQASIPKSYVAVPGNETSSPGASPVSVTTTTRAVAGAGPSSKGGGAVSASAVIVTPDRRTVGQPVNSGIAVALGRGLVEALGVAGSVAVASGVDAIGADAEATLETLGVGVAVGADAGALGPAVAHAATSTPASTTKPRRMARTSPTGRLQ